MRFPKRLVQRLHTLPKAAERRLPRDRRRVERHRTKSELPRLSPLRFWRPGLPVVAVQPNWDSPQSLLVFNSVDNQGFC